jgi:two-component system CheB/CheR fusion protein
VLVIEDNADQADSLKDLLELVGHEVRIARDGASGLFVVRAFRPSVVLCDVGLPGMDGYEFARALRSEDPSRDVWLVALTGYARPDDVRHAEEAGFDRHVAKPVTPETLEKILAEVPSGDEG